MRATLALYWLMSGKDLKQVGSKEQKSYIIQVWNFAKLTSISIVYGRLICNEVSVKTHNLKSYCQLAPWQAKT